MLNNDDTDWPAKEPNDFEESLKNKFAVFATFTVLTMFLIVILVLLSIGMFKFVGWAL